MPSNSTRPWKRACKVSMMRAFRMGLARRTITLVVIKRAVTIRAAAAATRIHSRLRRIRISGETGWGSSGMLASLAYARSLESMLGE